MEDIDDDTRKMEYWLNWRVLICGIWVLGSMASASFIIWKNEGSTSTSSDEFEANKRKQSDPHHHPAVHVHVQLHQHQHQLPLLYDDDDDDAWRTCLAQIHPIWLLAYRLLSLFLLSLILTTDFIIHGSKLLLYYTQWTFTLITIYFGLASILSLYGCYKRRHKIGEMSVMVNSQLSGGGTLGSTHGSYFPLSYGETFSSSNSHLLEHNSTSLHVDLQPRIWGHILQVLFQLTAGAVMLTDSVYWSIIFPFLTIYDYDLHTMTYLMHSVNFIFILGDIALNSLSFPWFRISYFVLWTGIFVISQWIIHACASIRWPYPFLDLSSPFSPLWYMLVGLMQLPCYGIFVMIVEAKVSFLSRQFPQSCQCRR